LLEYTIADCNANNGRKRGLFAGRIEKKTRFAARLERVGFINFF